MGNLNSTDLLCTFIEFKMITRAIPQILLLKLAFSAPQAPAYPSTYPAPTAAPTWPPTAAPTAAPTGPTTTTPVPTGCPVGWVESTEGCFLFHNTATGLTWRQGQEECEKLGGYLAEIKSEMQQAFLVSIANLE